MMLGAGVVVLGAIAIVFLMLKSSVKPPREDLEMTAMNMNGQDAAGTPAGAATANAHAHYSVPPPLPKPPFLAPGSQRSAAPAEVAEPKFEIVKLLLFLLIPIYAAVMLIIWAIGSISALCSAAVKCLEIIIDAIFLLAGSIALALGSTAEDRARVAHRGKEVVRGFEQLFAIMAEPLYDLADIIGVGDVARHLTAKWQATRALAPLAVDGGAEFAPPPAPLPLAPFAGRYEVISQIPGGGSSAEIYIVRRLTDGAPSAERLLLKCFDLTRGAGLDNLVRESEGMRLAKRVGIVTDYMFGDDYFYYVMPYYEGDSLTLATTRAFAGLAAGQALEERALRQSLNWVRQVTAEVAAFHEAGLIHKDIKPDNVIITTEGARLVDVGLVTQLSSAMTLTTHGTEYFRDPELVRMAVAGTRVNEVKAEKFDLYSLGALLYFTTQGTFPSTGRFSSYSRRVPYALSAIANKAMSDFEHRYNSAREIMEDLDAVLGARDLHATTPASLPSFATTPGLSEGTQLHSSAAAVATAPAAPTAEAAKRANARSGGFNGLALFAGVAMAALLMLGAFFFLVAPAPVPNPDFVMPSDEGVHAEIDPAPHATAQHATAPHKIPSSVQVPMQSLIVRRLRQNLLAIDELVDVMKRPVVIHGAWLADLPADLERVGQVVALEALDGIDPVTVQSARSTLEAANPAEMVALSRELTRKLGTNAPILLIAHEVNSRIVEFQAYLDGHSARIEFDVSSLERDR